MAASEVEGRGRVTIFSMFGPVFAYASRIEDGRQIAYIGPVTPGVDWRMIWKMATRCNRNAVSQPEKARWIISQANRALVCGDTVAKLSDSTWEMRSEGRRIDVETTWCWHDELVTGDMHVPSLTGEQTALKSTRWPHYAA